MGSRITKCFTRKYEPNNEVAIEQRKHDAEEPVRSIRPYTSSYIVKSDELDILLGGSVSHELDGGVSKQANHEPTKQAGADVDRDGAETEADTDAKYHDLEMKEDTTVTQDVVANEDSAVTKHETTTKVADPMTISDIGETEKSVDTKDGEEIKSDASGTIADIETDIEIKEDDTDTKHDIEIKEDSVQTKQDGSMTSNDAIEATLNGTEAEHDTERKDDTMTEEDIGEMTTKLNNETKGGDETVYDTADSFHDIVKKDDDIGTKENGVDINVDGEGEKQDVETKDDVADMKQDGGEMKQHSPEMKQYDVELKEDIDVAKQNGVMKEQCDTVNDITVKVVKQDDDPDEKHTNVESHSSVDHNSISVADSSMKADNGLVKVSDGDQGLV